MFWGFEEELVTIRVQWMDVFFPFNEWKWEMMGMMDRGVDHGTSTDLGMRWKMDENVIRIEMWVMSG